MLKYIGIELVFMLDHRCQARSRHLEFTGNKSFPLALNIVCKAMVFFCVLHGTYMCMYSHQCIRLAVGICVYVEPAQRVKCYMCHSVSHAPVCHDVVWASNNVT
jgi:hypothetical protein